MSFVNEVLRLHLQLRVDVSLLFIFLHIVNLHRSFLLRTTIPLDEFFQRRGARECRAFTHFHGQLNCFFRTRIDVAEAQDSAVELRLRYLDIRSLAFIQGLPRGADPA